ncbi:MAG TPA: hypothetical protein VEK57_12260 [Thermoanaerobaculia bacterium]|nr:hypothetical protein [Thermoanaerobaculia bacterium]
MITITKRLLLVLLLVAAAVPAQADFNAIARAIDGHRGVKRVWIPFLGVARFMVRAVEPKGVYDFQLATFEGTEDLDAQQLKEILRSKIGPGFTPLVQVWSNRRDEWCFIYAKPKGERIELVILARDDETVLVRVDVDADQVAREIHERPRQMTRMARR